MKDPFLKAKYFKLAKYITSAVVGAVIGFFFIYFVSTSEDITSPPWYIWAVLILISALTMILINQLSKWLDRKVPWQNYVGSRMLTGVLLISPGLLILVAGILKADLYFWKNNQETLTDSYGQLLVKVAIMAVIFSLIYSIVYFATYSYRQFATIQVETIRQARKQIDLQLKALKSQLSPHFLFNSLNSVSYLLHKEGADAERFIRELAHMYQYILESYDKKLVTVADELNFAIAYHHLLNIRFGEALLFNNKLDETILSTKIPPVTLQILLENAVKHNLIDDKNQLVINLEIKAEHLVISNNLTKTNKAVKSHKIGLKNIKDRYKLLAGKNIQITSDELFTVKLPIIR